jgi:hypothetical protein
MYGARRGHLGPVEESELISDIGMEVFDSVEGEWVSLVYTASAVGGYSSFSLNVLRDDGNHEALTSPDGSAIKSLKLRSGMYKQNQGTWFSMKILIESSGKFSCEFNYDEPPYFSIPPSDKEYLRDLKLFPRDQEHMPSWLQEKIQG